MAIVGGNTISLKYRCINHVNQSKCLAWSGARCPAYEVSVCTIIQAKWYKHGLNCDLCELCDCHDCKRFVIYSAVGIGRSLLQWYSNATNIYRMNHLGGNLRYYEQDYTIRIRKIPPFLLRSIRMMIVGDDGTTDAASRIARITVILRILGRRNKIRKLAAINSCGNASAVV